jgi:hypothetical protein
MRDVTDRRPANPQRVRHGADRARELPEGIERLAAFDAAAGVLYPGVPPQRHLAGTSASPTANRAWTPALLLDLLRGDHSGEAANRLIAVGILAAVPTAAAGGSDWAELRAGPAASASFKRPGDVIAICCTFARGGRAGAVGDAAGSRYPRSATACSAPEIAARRGSDRSPLPPPSGSGRFAHRSTSERIQTRVARRRATGSGKSVAFVHLTAWRRDVPRRSATSARPTRSSLLRNRGMSMMMTEGKCPPTTTRRQSRRLFRQFYGQGHSARTNPLSGARLGARHKPSQSRQARHQLPPRGGPKPPRNGRWSSLGLAQSTRPGPLETGRQLKTAFGKFRRLGRGN